MCIFLPRLGRSRIGRPQQALGKLIKFEEDAAGAARVDEGVPDAIVTGAGILGDQLNAAVTERRKGSSDIVDFQANVVQSPARFGQIAGDATVWRSGGDQFDFAVANRQEGDIDRFAGVVFDTGQLKAERIAPEFEGFADIRDDDGDMIDAENGHLNTTPVLDSLQDCGDAVSTVPQGTCTLAPHRWREQSDVFTARRDAEKCKILQGLWRGSGIRGSPRLV